jgi:hypothetical protein
MIVNCERISKDGRDCNICDRNQAVGRVYTQTRYDYEKGRKSISFNFCNKCAERFSDKMMRIK